MTVLLVPECTILKLSNMPAKSEKQRRLFYAVKGCKSGGKCNAKLRKIAKSLTTKQLNDFTKKKK